MSVWHCDGRNQAHLSSICHRTLYATLTRQQLLVIGTVCRAARLEPQTAKFAAMLKSCFNAICNPNGGQVMSSVADHRFHVFMQISADRARTVALHQLCCCLLPNAYSLSATWPVHNVTTTAPFRKVQQCKQREDKLLYYCPRWQQSLNRRIRFVSNYNYQLMVDIRIVPKRVHFCGKHTQSGQVAI